MDFQIFLSCVSKDLYNILVPNLPLIYVDTLDIILSKKPLHPLMPSSGPALIHWFCPPWTILYFKIRSSLSAETIDMLLFTKYCLLGPIKTIHFERFRVCFTWNYQSCTLFILLQCLINTFDEFEWSTSSLHSWLWQSKIAFLSKFNI